MSKSSDGQVMPSTSTSPKVVDLVIADMVNRFSDRTHIIACAKVCNALKARAEVGFVRYGTYLQPNNGRDQLLDGYQEILDCMKYIRCYMYENVDDTRMATMYTKLMDVAIEIGARVDE